MESLYRILNSNYLNLQKHAFSTHPNDHSMFQELDDLILQIENFINYIKFEYYVSIVYNIMAAMPALVYNYIKFSVLCQCDLLSTI